ncbi:MAG: DUF1513 domain-containing protein [Pseudomonas fragi]
MMRRQALKLGGLLLSAITLGGWSLFKQKGQSPLLLSARDDADGNHFAVGYRLDGTRVFSTRVGQRCHDIINHPTLPIALFVARRPGTESYLISLTDGQLLQTLTSLPNRHFYGHAVIHKDGEWLYTTENDTTDPGRGLLGFIALRASVWFTAAKSPPTASARIRCRGCLTVKHWWWPTAEFVPKPKAGSR